ncbi:ankyrin repeat domain-containing protein 53-like [Ptychodera flava]|uniref:ankyrin repeat domain-containing protein 53-like n=1 Tax=Ptychodera flava TaxID=63121 RepID=UPI00396A907A
MEATDTRPTIDSGQGTVQIQQSKPSIAKAKHVSLPGSAGKPRIVRKNSKLESDEYMAAAIGDTAWLKQSLRDGRDATTFDKNGLAAIHLAALHGRLDSVKLLVEKYGVDVNLPSSTGWRPIHLAINNRTGKRALQCVEYLLQKEADPSVLNDDDLTPAHQAAIEGTVKCLQAVINAGGLIDTRDVKGHLPIDYAKLWGNRDCARILTTEMWRQEKEQEAYEMEKLLFLKQLQDEVDEEEDEVQKAIRKEEADQAFSDWLERKHLPRSPSIRGDSAKKEQRAKKKDQSKAKPQEKLYKPNSAVKQDRALKRTEFESDDERRIKVWNKKEPKALHAITEGKGKSPQSQMAQRSPAPPRLAPLAIHDTKQLAVYDERVGSAAGYSESSMPKLPEEIIDRVMTGKPNPHDRPLVFKCKNIIDVQQKKFLPIDKRPKAKYTCISPMTFLQISSQVMLMCCFNRGVYLPICLRHIVTVVVYQHQIGQCSTAMTDRELQP